MREFYVENTIYIKINNGQRIEIRMDRELKII